MGKFDVVPLLILVGVNHRHIILHMSGKWYIFII